MQMKETDPASWRREGEFNCDQSYAQCVNSTHFDANSETTKIEDIPTSYFTE